MQTRFLIAPLMLCSALGQAQSAPAVSQAPPASTASLHDTLLAKAATLYYSAAKAGLRNFDCRVHPDWAGMMKSVRKGEPLPESDPRLALLDTVSITLHMNLKTGSSLEWRLPDPQQKPLDQDQTALLNQVHHGIEQSLGGILKMWTPLVDGSIAEMLGEERAQIFADANGYTLRSKTEHETVTEIFDNGLVLKRYILESATSANVDLAPTFKTDPQGLLPASFVGRLHGANTQGPAQEMDVSLEYQSVSGIEIPARITAVMPNVIEMDFRLDGCAVNQH